MSQDGEFEFIRRRLAPLAADYPGAFDLSDDAAVVSVPVGHELAVTSDTLIAGVHFLRDDPPGSVAVKAMRVSLSDLTAMGADPHAAMLSISWPNDATSDFRHAFADGLATELAARGIPLIGGDTTVSPGPWTITATLFGLVPAGEAVRRKGARPGDIIAVSGTIGDAGLGLKALTGDLTGMDEDVAVWTARYRTPPVRCALSPLLRQYASAAIDISDGLIADAGHIATASGVNLEIELDSISLSEASHRWLSAQEDKPAARITLASGGDDYEIFLTCRPGVWAVLQAGTNDMGVTLTRIGQVRDGQGVTVLDASGHDVEIARAGFTHF